MALKEFKLPDIGEGIAEGEIVSWKVKAGQTVKEEDEFVEVMTDKATVTITVPYAGVIKELRFKEGDVVPVGSVIATIDAGAGGGEAAAPAAKAEKPAPQAAAPAKQEQAKVVPAAPKQAPAPAKPAAAPAPAAKQAPAPAAKTATVPAPAAKQAPAAPAAKPAAFVQASPGKVLAAPATRRRARELGIDLSQVQATGPRGRITNDDVAGFTQRGAAPAVARDGRPPVRVAPPPEGREEERIPFRGLRRKIAEAMTRSKFTATHFTYVDDIDVGELVVMRKEAKEHFAEQGVNVTYLPFLMKAAVEAMKAFPMMNAALDETSSELVIKKYYNFGIATDTDNGLIVPVIKDVDRKSIAELARDLQDLASRTREGKVTVDDLTGGTFSITNAGNIGGLFATPIINFPEVAILGVHAIKDTPVIKNGSVVPGKVMYLSVSIDHRIVDGATGARWMNVVKEHLEQPWRLLLA
jgi:pyruvate dehydrogenase E2 component (dihydrolipoamide acetyltransferase)